MLGVARPPACSARTRDRRSLRRHSHARPALLLLASSRSQGRGRRGHDDSAACRRRREKTLEGAYDLREGFRSVDGILRFVEIGAIDLLGLDTSVARSNAMFRGALVAAKLLEVGDLEQPNRRPPKPRLATRQPDSPSPFDVDPDEIDAPSPFHRDPPEIDAPAEPSPN